MQKISHEEMSSEMVIIISESSHKIHKRLVKNLTRKEKKRDNFNELSKGILSEVILSITAITNHIYLENLNDRGNITEIESNFHNELYNYLGALYEEENKDIAINRINYLSEEYSSAFSDNNFLDKIVKTFTKLITNKRMSILCDIDIPDELSTPFPLSYMSNYEILSDYMLSLQKVINRFDIE